jgi:2-polyprenyl-3-methyl-5-hydroxy-6-metoxy-1,4-benzoquinol methylase
LQENAEAYDAVINFDVIEHIDPSHAEQFVSAMANNCADDGLCVIGTPNITTKPYASAVTNAGHINLYDGQRLYEEVSKVFRRVIMFGANDELVHTGFLPMCHYLIAVGIGPKRDRHATNHR